MTALRDAALDYASKGYPVFPLKPCDKIPAISKSMGGSGCLDATKDAETIKRWWDEIPDANIGLATGNGFWVLDIDGEVYR